MKPNKANIVAQDKASFDIKALHMQWNNINKINEIMERENMKYFLFPTMHDYVKELLGENFDFIDTTTSSARPANKDK